MNKHHIRLNISFTMDEMDGTAEQSAEIAMYLAEKWLREETPWSDCEVEVHSCYAVE